MDALPRKALWPALRLKTDEKALSEHGCRRSQRARSYLGLG